MFDEWNVFAHDSQQKGEIQLNLTLEHNKWNIFIFVVYLGYQGEQLYLELTVLVNGEISWFEVLQKLIWKD